MRYKQRFNIIFCGILMALLLFPRSSMAANGDIVANFKVNIQAFYQFMQSVVNGDKSLPSSTGVDQGLNQGTGGDLGFLAMQNYAAAASVFFDFFTHYIAAPFFAILLFYYIWDYTKNFYRRQNTPIVYFGQRFLIIFLTAALIMPIRLVYSDVKDDRATGLWLVLHAMTAGMDLAGIVTSKTVSAFSEKAGSASLSNPAFQTVFQDIQGSGSSADHSLSFLSLPETITVYEADIKTKAEQLEKNLEAKMQDDPVLEAAIQSAPMQKPGAGMSIVFTVIGGLMSFFAGSLMGGVMTATMLASMLGSLTGDTGSSMAGILNFVKSTITEPIFAIGLGISFYGAIGMLFLRTLIYAVIAPVAAIFIPMGQWGTRLIQNVLLNIAAIFLTPFLMLILWFVALIVHALFSGPFSGIMIALTMMIMNGSPMELLAVVIGSLVSAILFVTPLFYLFFRAPVMLGHFLGNVFSEGHEAAHHVKPPLLK